MSERAEHLHATASTQIRDLIALIAAADESLLRRPCPGREKLGDGTIAALAAHTTGNYERIATFAATAGGSAASATGERSGHQSQRSLRPGHQAPRHSHNRPGMHGDDTRYRTENVSQPVLVEQLIAAQGDLGRITELTDQQLDTVPPTDSFRFCDGQRTLEKVLTGLLKHQSKQVETLRAALTSTS